MYLVTWFDLINQTREEQELYFIWQVDELIANLENSAFNVDIDWMYLT